MTRILLLVFSAALATLHTNAQKITFTDTTNRWRVIHYHFDYISYGGGTYTGDTAVGGKIYHKMPGTNVYELLGIREDLSSGMIYFRFLGSKWRGDQTDTIERILFDYNLKQDDTLRMSYGRYRSAHYVDTVRYVMIGSTYYKTWFMRNAGVPAMWGQIIGGNPYTFIEGIGPTKDPYFPMYAIEFEDAQQLLCFSNGVWRPNVQPPVGSFDNDSSCRFKPPSSVSEVLLQAGVSVSPNPGGHNSTLRVRENSGPMVVQITDISGRIMERITSSQSEINIGQYLSIPGVYYYQILFTSTGQRIPGRLVFQ